MAPSSSWRPRSGGPLKPNESLARFLRGRYVLGDIFGAVGSALGFGLRFLGCLGVSSTNLVCTGSFNHTKR